MPAATAAETTEAATASASESHYSEGRPGETRQDAGAASARSETLFTAHGRMVRGLCRVLLRDAEEAEDAAQQTFLSAHRALLNGSEPREPAPWLAAIARNECWARIRARMRGPLLLGETEPSASASDALSEAIRRADLAALWRAIDGLPAPQRNALLLREFGGLSYDELAAALAVSSSAVESLLFRARRSLRERLGEAYAGVAGVGWLEGLGRLFAGGSGAAAPLAAKAVAVGVGAAVVAGGAAVAPTMLEHRGPSRPAAAHAATPPAAHRRFTSVGDFAPAARPPRGRPSAPAPVRPTAQPVVFSAPPTGRGDDAAGDGGGKPASARSAPSGEDVRTDPGGVAVATGGDDGVPAGTGGDGTQTRSESGDSSSSDGSGDAQASGVAPPVATVPGDGGGDNGGGDG